MKLNLVIVDDSPVWLSIAKKIANVHPAVENVFTFNDSLDAWIFLQMNNANVLMTDIEMPWMNGLSFLSMFGQKLNVISTSTEIDYKPHTAERGSVDFLSKPFSKVEFNAALTKVHKLVSHHQLV